MTTQELIELARKSLRENGNLPVVLYKDFATRWEVEAINPCNNHDHLLVVAGKPSRG